jgi:hypothetical protein
MLNYIRTLERLYTLFCIYAQTDVYISSISFIEEGVSTLSNVDI